MFDRIDPEFNAYAVNAYIVLPRGMSRVNACCAMHRDAHALGGTGPRDRRFCQTYR